MQKNNKLQYKSAAVFLFEIIKPHQKWYLIASTISIILVIIGLMQAKLSQILIDSSIKGDMTGIAVSISAFLIFILIHSFLEYLNDLCTARLSSSAGKSLKQNISKTLLYAEYKEIVNTRAGEVLKTVNVDTEAVCGFLENSLISLFAQFTMLIGSAIYLIYINPELMLITFIYTPVGMFFTLSLNKKMKNLYQINSDKNGKALSFAEQAISQIPVIKSFAAEKEIRNKLHGMYSDIAKTDKDISVWNALMQSACSSTSNIPKIIYLIYAGRLVMNESISIGLFIAVFELLNYIIAPTVYFPFLMNGFNRTIASVNRIEKIKLMKQNKGENSYNANIVHEENIIDIKDVNFGYDDSDKIINNLSFSHRGSGIIALCGKSGSGKTTVIDLICGLYNPDSGKINLSSSCSVVTQDGYIFADSLFNNIHIANPKAEYSGVLSAIRSAGLETLVNKLEQGENTIIGDGIRELSGGERQRVLLARTILSDAPIWLLDEPTSSLDAETEKIIINTIKEKSSEKLIIISAHRQTLIDIADRRINLI